MRQKSFASAYSLIHHERWTSCLSAIEKGCHCLCITTPSRAAYTGRAHQWSGSSYATEFFYILRELNREGTTIFLSSHILSEIQRNCTRAAIIREGKIIACDSVEALSKTNAKRVTVHGKVLLEGLKGIRDRKETDGSVSFLYSGDMNHLLRTLSVGQVSDLTVSEPDLEEIFLHYYEKDGKNI